MYPTIIDQFANAVPAVGKVEKSNQHIESQDSLYVTKKISSK